MNWTGHFHGFGPWVGSAKAYHREGDRRPPHPVPPPPGTETAARYMEAAEAFRSSSLPPVASGHWLLKRDQCAWDRTWTEATEAVEWMTKRYLDDPPKERWDGGEAYASLETKRAHALEVLPRGSDVSWVHYSRSDRIVSINVVCCPNRHYPELACPLPPSESRRAPVAGRGRSGAGRTPDPRFA